MFFYKNRFYMEAVQEFTDKALASTLDRSIIGEIVILSIMNDLFNNEVNKYTYATYGSKLCDYFFEGAPRPIQEVEVSLGIKGFEEAIHDNIEMNTSLSAEDKQRSKKQASSDLKAAENRLKDYLSKRNLLVK